MASFLVSAFLYYVVLATRLASIPLDPETPKELDEFASGVYGRTRSKNLSTTDGFEQAPPEKPVDNVAEMSSSQMVQLKSWNESLAPQNSYNPNSWKKWVQVKSWNESLAPQNSYNKTLDDFYNISSDGTNLWDNDLRLPQWIKTYLNWHKHKRKTWNTINWQSERWLIMQCLDQKREEKTHNSCGGTADRLRPVPYLLRLAYETKRILLIRWTKPAMLEEFLVPPKGGVDWRTPNWMAKILSNVSKGAFYGDGSRLRKGVATQKPLVRSKYQNYQYGSHEYDASLFEGEPTFDEVYPIVWRLFFRPSLSVASIIESQLDTLGLVPGNYASAHLRALYYLYADGGEPSQKVIEGGTRNALNCASQLRPGAPIFFTSDSEKASNYSHIYAGKMNAQVITRTPSPNPPLHLELCKDWMQRPPSDFYDTFVDLYLIGLGGCVTFGKGGFGRWGWLIGGNFSCRINRRTINRVDSIKCSWQNSSETARQVSMPGTPLFLEPMAPIPSDYLET